jgi:hypothetical protein
MIPVVCDERSTARTVLTKRRVGIFDDIVSFFRDTAACADIGNFGISVKMRGAPYTVHPDSMLADEN